MTTPSHPRPDRWRDVTPDDRALHDATREFWGDDADWARSVDGPAENERVVDARGGDHSRAGRGGNVGRWWGSLSGGRTAGTRTHTPALPESASRHPNEHGVVTGWGDGSDNPPDDQLADRPDDQWDDGWETTPSPAPTARSGVDPLLARFAGLAVIVTLLVPVFLGFTSDSDDAAALRPAAAPPQVPAPTDASSTTPNADTTPATPAPATPAPATPAPTAAAATASAAAQPQAAVESIPTSGAPTTTTNQDTAGPTVPSTDGATAAALSVDTCAVDYDVVAGDFWIRIADGSGTSLAELLDVNDASLDTALFPGRSICLPAGANIPAPPTTTAPTTPPVSTSPRPSATRSSSGATTTQPAVAPVVPPATVRPAAPPASSASPAEVEAIIRAVWPDDLESRAIEIAQRESKLRATAKNSCCYGVFQIYWSVHKSWLAGLGITAADQLYDPTLNARAALALYQRAGSWGPWGG